MLIVDDREKWTHKGSRDTHLKKYFDRHGIMYRVQRLDVGDYMLDGGKIAEMGSHEELMALNGRYAHFFNEQAQWYGVSQAAANGGADA